MSALNNIFNIKASTVISNGSINFGNSLHKGHSANQKAVGGYIVIGDGSFSMNSELSNVSDPDFIDQPNSQV